MLDACLIRGCTEKIVEIFCFKTQGVATVLMHKQMAVNIVKVVGNNEEDESVHS